MNKNILIPIIFLGIISVTIYSSSCLNYRKRFEIQIAINAILQSAGIVCGIALMLSSVFEEVQKFVSDLDLYIFIAGFTIFCVSTQELYRGILSKVIPIRGNYSSMSQNLLKASPQIENLIEQWRNRGANDNFIQKKITRDIVNQAQKNPKVHNKLLDWYQSLQDLNVNKKISEIIKRIINDANENTKK